MRKENILVIVLIVIAVVGIGTYFMNGEPTDVPLSTEGGISWKEYTEGMALAKQENKQIFLYFHADW